MKKFLILLSATLIASSVNAQLYINKSGKLRFGNISSTEEYTTAWEGTGHYFHNSASTVGNTWLKIDLSTEAPAFRSNADALIFHPTKSINNWFQLDLSNKYPAFVTGNNILTLKNNSGGGQLFIDLSRNRPYLYSNSSSLFFKSNSISQNLYAGTLYTVAEMRSGSTFVENALDKVARLSPRQFEPGPIAARRSLFYGFLSSDMERVLPELVSEDSEGMKYINYVELIPILTKAIQDLTLKVQEQAERIAQLERQIDPKTKP